MRTDPSPREVREIVEGVFAGYSGKQGNGINSVLREGNGMNSVLREGNGINSVLRRPRLYEPEADFGSPDSPEIDENILIDRGRYVARSYRVEGYLAMWLVGVGILQFYDDRGRMLGTINLFTSLQAARLAA